MTQSEKPWTPGPWKFSPWHIEEDASDVEASSLGNPETYELVRNGG